MRISPPAQALVAGTLFLVSACSDRTEPTAPDNTSAPVSLQPQLQGTADDPIALGRQVAGFGGFYLDEQGTPVVYLKQAAERSNAERALGPFLQRQGLSPSQLRVLPARYDWAQLEDWQLRVSSEVLSIPGAVFVDADEARNRVTIGLERGALARVSEVVARLAIPRDAVMIQETAPIRFAATLQSRVRPVVGGLQINFLNFACTLGFNAIRNGQNSFITNSHCTNVQGGTEGTIYYQPVPPGKIATEVSDPAYSKTVNGCPPGRRCRFSDASRAAYASDITFKLGKIAKTSGPNNNSSTISGSFSISAEGNASVGQVVSKVGRTTGWTRGRVTNRCVNTNLKGTNITQLCQTWVSAKAGAGDSGSPVFKGSTNVTLVGILWGGDDEGTVYVYSPISNIERELGALTTF
jgi:hypothetical protein